MEEEMLEPREEPGVSGPADKPAVSEEELRAQWAAELKRAEEGFNLRLIFERAGAPDSKQLAELMREKAVFSEEGVPENGADILSEARKLYPGLFPAPKVEGVHPAEGTALPVNFSAMSFSERAQFFAADPEGYRRARSTR